MSTLFAGVPSNTVNTERIADPKHAFHCNTRSVKLCQPVICKQGGEHCKSLLLRITFLVTRADLCLGEHSHDQILSNSSRSNPLHTNLRYGVFRSQNSITNDCFIGQKGDMSTHNPHNSHRYTWSHCRPSQDNADRMSHCSWEQSRED